MAPFSLAPAKSRRIANDKHLQTKRSAKTLDPKNQNLAVTRTRYIKLDSLHLITILGLGPADTG